MLKSIAKVFSVSTIGKILGFIKILLLTRFFGASAFTDAIIIVVNIFWFWSNEIVFSLFSNTLIPKLAKVESDKVRIHETLKILTSANILTLFFFICTVLIGRYVLYIFAPSASEEFFNYGVILMLVMSPIALLMPLTEIFTLLNQYKENYFISAINMTVWNIFQIIAILISHVFLSPILLIYLFGVLTILGYIITSYIQLSTVGFFNFYRIFDLFKISLSAFKESVNENYKFFLATVFSQINIYVNYAFISTLIVGSITIYDIILKIPNVFQSVLISTLAIIYFNAISNNLEKINNYFRKFNFGMIGLVVPILIIIKFFGLDILHLIYGVKVFEGRDGILTILLLAFVNVFFVGKFSLLIKTTIVNGKSNYLLILTLCGVIINATLNSFFVKEFGLEGIMFTTLLVNIFLSLLLQHNLFNKGKNYHVLIFSDLLLLFLSIVIYLVN